MRRTSRAGLFALLLAAATSSAGVAGARAAAPAAATGGAGFPRIAILCYHDLSDDPAAPLQTVPASFLRAQIRACREQGWTFLSLAELLAHRDHPEQLPPRVMVLTFDDGYRSFAEQALPILRAEHIRPTLAIITSFPDEPHADLPPLLGWARIRDLDRAGDVEIASHSHAQHRYEVSNPALDTAPAIATRRWLSAERRYEDREEYRGRVGDDLAESQRVLRRELGHAATTLVWPYGMHNEMARGLAAREGFGATLALGGREVTPADLRAGCLPRVMVTRRMEFAAGDAGWLLPPPLPVRAAQVDLDALWDPDESVFRGRLDLAVQRAGALGATCVILPVCPDPRGDGQLLRAFAMNHQLPVLADVWSMAAAKFAAAGLRVWVRAPALNLTWAWTQHPEWRLRSADRGNAGSRWGTRLSPDLPDARAAAVDFFTDLAVYLPFDGVVFDDDTVLLPGEKLALDPDAGPATRAAALRGWLEACKQAVRAWRPECRFARAVPAAVVLHDGLDPATAQDLADGFAHDELTVVEPVDGGHGGVPSAASIAKLARRALERWRAFAPPAQGQAPAPPPTLLLLPALDPRTHEGIPAPVQQALALAALQAGAWNLGTGPVTAEGPLPIGLLQDAALPSPAPRAQARY